MLKGYHITCKITLIPNVENKSKHIESKSCCQVFLQTQKFSRNSFQIKHPYLILTLPGATDV